jgi:hypothetical protein
MFGKGRSDLAQLVTDFRHRLEQNRSIVDSRLDALPLRRLKGKLRHKDKSGLLVLNRLETIAGIPIASPSLR